MHKMFKLVKKKKKGANTKPTKKPPGGFRKESSGKQNIYKCKKLQK